MVRISVQDVLASLAARLMPRSNYCLCDCLLLTVPLHPWYMKSLKSEVLLFSYFILVILKQHSKY